MSDDLHLPSDKEYRFISRDKDKANFKLVQRKIKMYEKCAHILNLDTKKDAYFSQKQLGLIVSDGTLPSHVSAALSWFFMKGPVPETPMSFASRLSARYRWKNDQNGKEIVLNDNFKYHILKNSALDPEIKRAFFELFRKNVYV